MAEPQLRRMTQEEFFAWQLKQPRLFELVEGRPQLTGKAVHGAMQAHDRVQVNIIASVSFAARLAWLRPAVWRCAFRMERSDDPICRSMASKGIAATWWYANRAS